MNDSAMSAAKLRITTSGNGNPVVYLKSGGAPAELAALLGKHYRVLSVDIADGSEAAARSVGEAIKSVGATRVSVVAHGAAAGAALWLAATSPEVIEGIVAVAPAALNAAGEVTDAALAARLPDVKAQVLALFGTNDLAAPPQLGKRYREKLPNCHLVFVYDAGQNLDAERPAAVAAVMLDFLERREQFVVSVASSKLYP